MLRETSLAVPWAQTVVLSETCIVMERKEPTYTFDAWSCVAPSHDIYTRAAPSHDIYTRVRRKQPRMRCMESTSLEVLFELSVGVCEAASSRRASTKENIAAQNMPMAAHLSVCERDSSVAMAARSTSLRGFTCGSAFCLASSSARAFAL